MLRLGKLCNTCACSTCKKLNNCKIIWGDTLENCKDNCKGDINHGINNCPIGMYAKED